jgi:PAS domain S-box-containing protein
MDAQVLHSPLSSSSSAAPSHKTHKQGYVLIVGLFLLLLSVSLFVSWNAIETIDDTRAYAIGEARYSKAQKMAVIDLYRYADSRQQADYDAFLKDIDVPLGDRAAREAMTAAVPDYAAAARGFLRGRNHPSDVPGMIRQFRRFSWWRYFAAAIEDWRIADGYVAALVDDARDLHGAIAQGRLDAPARALLLSSILAHDARLTERENMIYGEIGQAARLASTLVAVGLGASTILLWTIGTFFASRLLRRQLSLDAQLTASERRFRDYAEVASDWYWEMDSHHRIKYMSERIYDIMNVPSGTVIDFDALKMIRDSALDATQGEVCIKAIEERRPFRGINLRFVAKDGSHGYGAISGKPAFGDDGEYLGYRGVGADITEQIRHADALRAAKITADHANRAKSDFLANMSHELRTPLNAILGFSDLIAERAFGDDAVERYAEYARDVHKSGAHLLSIINDILDLSKIEAGQTTLKEHEIPFERIVERSRALLGDRGQGIAFRLELEHPTPTLCADERMLIQILVNLLSNAFKFTPPGGSVTLSGHTRADGSFAFAVRDTGIGIAPEYLEKVLAPFGQVESAFNRNHQGTGLGLPLAKSLAELHGGSLTLESEPDKGTTVTVVLPAQRVLPTQAARARA